MGQSTTVEKSSMLSCNNQELKVVHNLYGEICIVIVCETSFKYNFVGVKINEVISMYPQLACIYQAEQCLMQNKVILVSAFWWKLSAEVYSLHKQYIFYPSLHSILET